MSALAAALDVKFSASCKLNACFEVISQQIYRILSPHPFVHCTLVRQGTFKISPPHSCHVKPSWSLTDTPREMRFCRSLGLGLYTTNNTFLLLWIVVSRQTHALSRKVSCIPGILDEYPCMDVCIWASLVHAI